MLTDTKLRNLKPGDKLYKVNERDGLYVAVTPAGSISFRYNYSINGRQETMTFGRYGVGGITLAEAREQLGDAKKMVAAGKSPAKEKARDKARVKDAETFGAWAEKWLRGYQMADFTRDMRRSVYERELKPKFGNQKLVELTHEDLRALTDAIVERGAPATAVHTREIVMQVFRWAIERGQKVENPADLVRPTSIAKFEPRDRALTPDEIGLMYRYMERVGTSPRNRAAAKLLLLTMVSGTTNENIDKLMHALQCNGMEDIHTFHENSAQHLMAELANENLAVLDMEQNWRDFCAYFGQQATRTKRTRDMYLQAMSLGGVKQEIIESVRNTWWLNSFLLGINVAASLINEHRTTRVSMFINNTSIPFITSDLGQAGA